jgi:hypothetical protein
MAAAVLAGGYPAKARQALSMIAGISHLYHSTEVRSKSLQTPAEGNRILTASLAPAFSHGLGHLRKSPAPRSLARYCQMFLETAMAGTGFNTLRGIRRPDGSGEAQCSGSSFGPHQCF